MTKLDLFNLAKVVLAGYTIKFFRSKRNDSPNIADPWYRGWYFLDRETDRWIGAYKTRRQCVEDVLFLKLKDYTRRGPDAPKVPSTK